MHTISSSFPTTIVSHPIGNVLVLLLNLLSITSTVKARQTSFIVSHQPVTQFACG